MAVTRAGLAATRLPMWPERTDAHVGSYAGSMCNDGVSPVKGMGLSSKLRLECRQGFCLGPESRVWD